MHRGSEGGLPTPPTTPPTIAPIGVDAGAGVWVWVWVVVLVEEVEVEDELELLVVDAVVRACGGT